MHCPCGRIRQHRLVAATSTSIADRFVGEGKPPVSTLGEGALSYLQHTVCAIEAADNTRNISCHERLAVSGLRNHLTIIYFCRNVLNERNRFARLWRFKSSKVAFHDAPGCRSKWSNRGGYCIL